MSPRNRKRSTTLPSDDEINQLAHAERCKPNCRSDSRPRTGTSYRTDTEWVSSLTGKDGPDSQQLAHIDLSNYLYVVIFNYLKSRRPSLPSLIAYSDEELIPLAQDFVQNYMVKMVKDDYALLKKYSTVGRFTSWAAQVALNMCATEFRRASWSRQVQMAQQPYWDQRAILPETAAARSQLAEALESCLDQLPEHYREALVRCVAEGERASTVAADLDVSPNAVYILIHRAKSAMRKHLTRAGINSKSLETFRD